MAPKVCRKTHDDLFLEVTPKKVFMIFVGEQLQVKVARTSFRASLGRCGQKSLGHTIAPRKCACSHTYDEKASPPPLPPFLKKHGKCPRHASILRRPCAYYSARTLYSLLKAAKCHCKEHKLYYQRYPDTEQFTTAKICGNALKQGSRTHSVLR